MLRKKSLIFTMILIVFAAFYLINCDGDSGTESTGGGGNGDTPTPAGQELLGTWEVTNISVTIPGVIDTSGPPSDPFFAELGMPSEILITFYEDSTNKAVLTWPDSTDSANGTWSVSGNQLTATLPLLEAEQIVTGPYSVSEDGQTMTFTTSVAMEYPGFGTINIPATLTLQKREDEA